MPPTPRRPRCPLALFPVSALLALLAACGGGASSAPPPPPRKLLAVTVTPDRPSVALGLQPQLTATATYDDGQSVDATGSASWTSSDPAVATVDDTLAKGRLTTLATGAATVTATVDGVAGATTVTVSPPALASIELRVHPMLGYARNEGRLLAVGALRPFVAIVTLTDRTVADATDSATWSSSDPARAGVVERAGHRGWVSGVAPGPATITASLGTVQGSAVLEIGTFVALSSWMPTTVAPRVGGIGIDDSGRAQAIWSHQFTGGPSAAPPVMATSGYDPATGWSTPALLDFGTVTDRPGAPRPAVNGSGAALAAWAGHDGIYASVLGAAGWQQVRTVASGTSPYQVLGEYVSAAIDAAGNGLVAWADSNDNSVYFSRYDHTADTFSAATPVPGAVRGMAHSPLLLAMNPSGAAVLVWEQWGTAWKIFASRFVPGTAAGAGWQAPEAVDDATSWQEPSVAMDGSGRIVVAWVDGSFDTKVCSVCARRHDPATGWSAQETILAQDPRAPASARIAMNGSGAAIVAWHDSTFAVRVSRADAGGSWKAPETLDPGTTSASTPDVLPPHVAADGRMQVLWIREAFNLPRVARSRFSPGVGWGPAEPVREFQHFGKVNRGGIGLAFNGAGDGVALWQEDYDVTDPSTWLTSTWSDIFAEAGLPF